MGRFEVQNGKKNRKEFKFELIWKIGIGLLLPFAAKSMSDRWGSLTAARRNYPEVGNVPNPALPVGFVNVSYRESRP